MEAELDQIADGERQWVPVLREFWEPFSGAGEGGRGRDAASQRGPGAGRARLPTCGHPLVIRWGRYGKFIGCSTFPECRYVEPWLEKIGVKCPKDGGELAERKTRKGRVFYGCANYPQCDFTSWKRPLPEPCPKCGGLLTATNRIIRSASFYETFSNRMLFSRPRSTPPCARGQPDGNCPRWVK